MDEKTFQPPDEFQINIRNLKNILRSSKIANPERMCKFNYIYLDYHEDTVTRIDRSGYFCVV